MWCPEAALEAGEAENGLALGGEVGLELGGTGRRVRRETDAGAEETFREII